MKKAAPQSEQGEHIPDSAERAPDARVVDLPQQVSGRRHCFGICRGATIASARMANGQGPCVASMLQVHGQPLRWWVRTQDDRLHEFEDEPAAVAFFMSYLRRLAN